MTTSTLKTAIPTAASTATAPVATGQTPAEQPVRHRRRAALVTAGVLAAVTATGLGVVVGLQLTDRPAPATPAVSGGLPADWQAYRAGERGVVATSPRPADWTQYRAGERGASSAVVGTYAATVPVTGRAADWSSYRADEREPLTTTALPADWQAYRAGER